MQKVGWLGINIAFSESQNIKIPGDDKMAVSMIKSS